MLSSGENVEPSPIEDVLCCSPWIKHAMLVGQASTSSGAGSGPGAARRMPPLPPHQDALCLHATVPHRTTAAWAR